MDKKNKLRQKIINYGQYMYELGLFDAEKPESKVNPYEVAEIEAEQRKLIEV